MKFHGKPIGKKLRSHSTAVHAIGRVSTIGKSSRRVTNAAATIVAARNSASTAASSSIGPTAIHIGASAKVCSGITAQYSVRT